MGDFFLFDPTTHATTGFSLKVIVTQVRRGVAVGTARRGVIYRGPTVQMSVDQEQVGQRLRVQPGTTERETFCNRYMLLL